MKYNTQKRILCKICNHNAKIILINDIHFNLTKVPLLKDIKQIHCRCSFCHTVFLSNQFTDEEIASAYAGWSSKEYYDNCKETNRLRLKRSLSDLKKALEPSKSVIIDIGVGSGEFVNLLAEEGFLEVAGHDIPSGDHFAISKENENKIKIFKDFDYNTLPKSYFDAVTHLDVAEHVRDPFQLFGACNKTLKKNGLLYFHTPVVTPMDRLMHFVHKIPILNKFSNYWQTGRTSIYHLQNYTKKSLQIVLEASGFEISYCNFENELTRPLSEYIDDFFVKRFHLPSFLTPFLVPFFYPILKSNLLNPNKAIVLARKVKELD